MNCSPWRRRRIGRSCSATVVGFDRWHAVRAGCLLCYTVACAVTVVTRSATTMMSSALARTGSTLRATCRGRCCVKVANARERLATAILAIITILARNAVASRPRDGVLLDEAAEHVDRRRVRRELVLALDDASRVADHLDHQPRLVPGRRSRRGARLRRRVDRRASIGRVILACRGTRSRPPCLARDSERPRRSPQLL